MRIVFLNTTILTGEGTFHCSKLSLEEAKEIISKIDDRLSAVGHDATAKIMSQLLDIEIVPNRITYAFEPDDVNICFKLAERVPEGKILTEDELSNLKYDFYVIVNVDDFKWVASMEEYLSKGN